jgi:hypothetical protein
MPATLTRGTRIRSERGLALLAVLMMLAMVTVISAGLWVSGQTEVLIARNHETSAQSQAAAEAGLNHAIDVALGQVRNWQVNGFATPCDAMSALLRGPDDLAGTAGADADNGSLEAFGVPRPPLRTMLASVPNTGYEAQVFDEDDPARGVALSAPDTATIGENTQPVIDNNTTIIVRAIGYAAGGTTTTLEASVGPGPPMAILSGGDLTLNGSVALAGANGSVHTNGDLTLTGGGLSVSANATASGTYTVTGNPSIGGQSGGGLTSQSLPTPAAVDYRSAANYILEAGGRMTDQGGTLICDASGTPTACQAAGYQWVYGGASGWSMSAIGANGDAKTWYAESDAVITGNVGTAQSPLTITLIAEGSIDISGNSTFQANTPGVMFVTDEDLRMAGGSDQVGAEAYSLVREQFSANGSGTLLGQLLVQDAAAVSSLVTSTSIGGNVTITNNGTLPGFGFSAMSWRMFRPVPGGAGATGGPGATDCKGFVAQGNQPGGGGSGDPAGDALAAADAAADAASSAWDTVWDRDGATAVATAAAANATETAAVAVSAAADAADAAAAATADPDLAAAAAAAAQAADAAAAAATAAAANANSKAAASAANPGSLMRAVQAALAASQAAAAAANAADAAQAAMDAAAAAAAG